MSLLIEAYKTKSKMWPHDEPVWPVDPYDE